MKKITLLSLIMLSYGFVGNAQNSITEVTEGDFPTEIFSTGKMAQENCDQQETSNNFENGFGNTNAGIIVADDIVVADSEILTLQTITYNMINNGGYTDVNVIFYENNNGVPGEEISNQVIVPDSQDVIGTAFGRDVQEVVVTLNDEVVLEGVEGSETTFWIGIVTPNFITAGSDSYWETSTASSSVLTVASSNDGMMWNTTDSNGDPLPAAAVFLLEGQCDPLLGVEENISTALSIFPNPAVNEVIINTKGQFSVASVAVFDMLGKRVSIAMSDNTVDISSMRSGLYIFEITTTNGEVGTYKVVKQ